MNEITTADLAARVRRTGNRASHDWIAAVLEEWARRGVVEQVARDRWRLTAHGYALGKGLLEADAAAEEVAA